MRTSRHPSLDPRINLLIGIDDTDNLETRGTGYRARCLGDALADAGVAELIGITRHQLLVDPRIPYTSHNSSACLQVNAHVGAGDVQTFCREFMLEVAADGSDVGLCVADVDAATQVVDYGLRAKQEVLDQDVALRTAASLGIRLEGLTGTRGGIIGALAGIGLYVHGDDGRYIWLRQMRELRGSTVTLGELKAATGIEDVIEFDSNDIVDRDDAVVDLGAWARPVRVAGRSVLLVERSSDGQVDYAVADKHRIKQFRP